MTSAFVVDNGRVHLDGFEYRLQGPVVSQLSSRYAQKIIIGQPDMNAHEEVSYLRWDDFSGGVGLKEFFLAGGEAPNRAWWSDCDLSMPQHTTLGPLTVTTTTVEGTFPSINAGDAEPVLQIFKNELYMLTSNIVSATQLPRIYKYNNSTDSWGTAVHACVDGNSYGPQYDMVAGIVNGVDSIIACHGTGYVFSTDGASWTDDTADFVRVTIHDGALWGITYDGTFSSSTTLGTEVAKAKLPIPIRSTSNTLPYVTDLVTMADASGEPRIHAVTSYGIYTYDQTNDAWTQSNIQYPEAKYNGLGTTMWNSDIYIPTGMSLWRAIYGERTQLFPVGPDQDHGLPGIKRGAIADLAAGHRILAACVDGYFFSFRNYITSASAPRGSIMAYDGVGWQVLFQSSTALERMKSCVIGSAYDVYRIWFSSATGTTARTVYYIDLPSERVDPTETETLEFGATGTLETPIYHVGQDVKGLALSVLLETRNTDANNTIAVAYDIDATGTYTTIGTVVAAGDTTYTFPSAADTSGSAFRSIQFKLTFTRNSTTTNHPDLHSLTLKFLPAIPYKQEHMLTLDLTTAIGAQTPRDQWKNFHATVAKNKLLEFTFHDDDSTASIDRFYVRIKDFRSRMNTGYNYGGTIELDLVEV